MNGCCPQLPGFKPLEGGPAGLGRRLPVTTPGSSRTGECRVTGRRSGSGRPGAVIRGYVVKQTVRCVGVCGQKFAGCSHNAIRVSLSLLGSLIFWTPIGLLGTFDVYF